MRTGECNIMKANTMYQENGIAAQQYMEETERLANAQYRGNALAIERYMEETSRSASIVY